MLRSADGDWIARVAWMPLMRNVLCVCAMGLAVCQDVTFYGSTQAVLVPVTVTDSKGRYIEDLSVDDFVVLDNGRRQDIRMDAPGTSTIPLAVLFLVQADDVAATALMKIRKVGSMVEPLITGDRGHAAVLAYGTKLDLLQDFTNDPELITRAFNGLKTQDGRRAPMLDAVANGVSILNSRPSEERRVLVIVGESRDRGSKAKFEEVVKLVQRQSVTVFSFVYSAYLTPFTTKGSDMPPPGDTDMLGIITEPARMAKKNTAVALADSSGGRKLSFTTLKGLEQTLGKTGEELHSQYSISYTPVDRTAGFHTIVVQVKDRSDAVIRARPGYWMAER